MTDEPAERDEPAGDPEVEDGFDFSGLSTLREAVANRATLVLPSGGTIRQDGVAGLNSAIGSMPDGMANGLLAGVNPIYGLYACMVGPLAGGILSSSRLMVITSTSAAALAVGASLDGVPSGKRDDALFVMVVLVGVIQAVAGLLKLGRLTRFVSYSVMTGFLMGVAVVLILSQLPTLAGYQATGNNKVGETLNLLTNLGQADLRTVALGVLTLGLAVALPRTRVGNFGTLVAIAVPSVLAFALSLDSVQVVKDVGEIPSGVPTPSMPDFFGFSLTTSLDLLTGSLAVAAIGLVQGAGVSQSVPNPGGSRSRVSRDFLAQGVANVGSGLFRGLPVGGSVGSTALSIVAGAQTRWAAILSGLWVAAIVILLPGPVSYIVMPALGALLIIAGVRSIKPADARAVMRTDWPTRLAAVVTFLATLLLPIQAAVGLGVLLSAFIYVLKSSSDISVVELVRRPDGRVEEREPPKTLAAGRVTVIDVYGSLFFAGARTLERMLPQPADGPGAVVLRLRGHSEGGATLIEVLSAYAQKLEAAGGRLFLSGLNRRLHGTVVDTRLHRPDAATRAYEATSIVGASTEDAYDDAVAWLAEPPEERPGDGAR